MSNKNVEVLELLGLADNLISNLVFAEEWTEVWYTWPMMYMVAAPSWCYAILKLPEVAGSEQS